jgi:phosphoribosyl 1,2-cyclic phosphodiesterase
MRIHILASGSTGNAALIEIGGHRFLIDAGISCRHIELALQGCGYRGWDISAVLLTHEHSDHVKGLEVLARRYRLPVFTREKTWNSLACEHKLPFGCMRLLEDELTIGGVSIEALSISHDAADPVSFVLRGEGKKCAFITDIGESSPQVEDALAGADAAVLESNHDVTMLENGPYPAYLKHRIRGKKGHLSNTETGALLSKMRPQKPYHVFLAHMSQENNRPELAVSSVAQMITASGSEVGKDFILHKTYPYRRNSLVL